MRSLSSHARAFLLCSSAACALSPRVAHSVACRTSARLREWEAVPNLYRRFIVDRCGSFRTVYDLPGPLQAPSAVGLSENPRIASCIMSYFPLGAADMMSSY
jgi:hypothetical protein